MLQRDSSGQWSSPPPWPPARLLLPIRWCGRARGSYPCGAHSIWEEGVGPPEGEGGRRQARVEAAVAANYRSIPARFLDADLFQLVLDVLRWMRGAERFVRRVFVCSLKSLSVHLVMVSC